MNSTLFRRLGVAGLIALGCTAALGREGEGALPAEQRAGNIAYVTGGIDLGQSAAFQRARSRYPLAIELLQRSGNRNQYTADAQVRVVDAASGNAAFEARADGPYMLVRMPSGSYRVDATLNGHTESKVVRVGGRGNTRVALIFPEGIDSEPAPQPVRNGTKQ